ITRPGFYRFPRPCDRAGTRLGRPDAQASSRLPSAIQHSGSRFLSKNRKRNINRAPDPELVIGVVPIHNGTQMEAVTPMELGSGIAEAELNRVVIFPEVARINNVKAVIAGGIDRESNVRA